jgi:hypothetical protein
MLTSGKVRSVVTGRNDDGNDRLTLEVFGTNMDATTRNTAGTYAMYATPGGTGDTFHRTWKTSYFNKKTVNTIVIKPK